MPRFPGLRNVSSMLADWAGKGVNRGGDIDHLLVWVILVCSNKTHNITHLNSAATSFHIFRRSHGGRRHTDRKRNITSSLAQLFSPWWLLWVGHTGHAQRCCRVCHQSLGFLCVYECASFVCYLLICKLCYFLGKSTWLWACERVHAVRMRCMCGRVHVYDCACVCACLCVWHARCVCGFMRVFLFLYWFFICSVVLPSMRRRVFLKICTTSRTFMRLLTIASSFLIWGTQPFGARTQKSDFTLRRWKIRWRVRATLRTETRRSYSRCVCISYCMHACLCDCHPSVYISNIIQLASVCFCTCAPCSLFNFSIL